MEYRFCLEKEGDGHGLGPGEQRGENREGGGIIRETLEEYCTRTGQRGLLAEWDLERNGGQGPDGVSGGSSRRVWWRCGRGHRWQAPVFARSRDGSGCPYCGGKLPIPGQTDLATRFPEVAAQWHTTLNGSLTPDMVTAGSRRKVWWECPYGHVWKAAVYARAGEQHSGCPVCAGRVRSRRAPAAAAWGADQSSSGAGRV